MKRICYKLHLWLSIPFGIIISILCLTGALLVFESEIKEWVSPSLYQADRVGEAPLPIDALMDAVKQQLPDSVVLTSIRVSSHPRDNYRLGVAGQGRTSLLVDPYTGEIKGNVNPYGKGDFFSFVRRLHRWFLFEHKREGISRGKMITGTTTLVFVLILISGAVIWIPQTVRQLKVRLKIHTRLSRFRFWYDTHLAGGIYVLLFLLVISLTGLTWSFDWYRKGFYALFGVQTEQTAPQPAQQSGDKSPVNYAVWTDVLHSLERAYPRYKTITIYPGKATVAINRTGNTRASDSHTFHPLTGEITDSHYYEEQPKAVKIRGWIYSVHVGTWGGWITRVIYFIVCLMGASLPWSGYYMYIRKRRNGQ